MTKALGGKRAKAGTTSRIADNGDFYCYRWGWTYYWPLKGR